MEVWRGPTHLHWFVCTAERSNLMIVDLQSFHIIKEIQGITQDMQSAVTTMDGKYLLIVTAGFQRFASGVFVLVSGGPTTCSTSLELTRHWHCIGGPAPEDGSACLTCHFLLHDSVVAPGWLYHQWSLLAWW